jgi:hypothetical protein
MKEERPSIIICLVNKFEMEYEKLLNNISNFNTEEKLHITKIFLEIVNLRRRGEAEWSNITELYQKELREKYRERFAEGHRINLLAYLYDGAILDKSRGDGEFDYYTKEEFNNLKSSEVQLLSEGELQSFLHFIGNYLTSTRDTFLDKPRDFLGNVKNEIEEVQMHAPTPKKTFDAKIFPSLRGSLIFDQMIEKRPKSRYKDYCVFVIKKLVKDGLMNDIKEINYKDYISKTHSISLDKFKSLTSITTDTRTELYNTVKDSIK